MAVMVPETATCSCMKGYSMILIVTPDRRKKYLSHVRFYLKLRKRIFVDQYGWISADDNGLESDILDESFCIYILHVDPNTDQVNAGVRLAPTTGKTLLHTAWVDMLPEQDDFRSPDIWEATRFCVDDNLASKEDRQGAVRVAMELMNALLSFAIENRIGSIIAVCERRFVDLMSVFTGAPDIISEKIDENGCHIACVIWSSFEKIDERVSARENNTQGKLANLIESTDSMQTDQIIRADQQSS